MGCDAVLINPRYSFLDNMHENIGLGYVASYSRAKGKKVEILDLPTKGWDIDRVVSYLKETSPSLVGISILFQEGAREALHLINQLRDGGVQSRIVIGGIYPSFEYEALLNNHHAIDFVCIGEGEETFFHLIECIREKGHPSEVKGIAYREGDRIVTAPARSSVEDLDILPFPARDILPEMLKYKSFVSVVGSRGCYGRCSFCSVNGFFSSIGPKYRCRSPQNIVKEIEFLISNYRVNKFTFDDAIFIGSGDRGKARVREFARLLEEKGLQIEYSIECRVNDVEKELFKTLKDAGLARVYLGVESGSQSQLDRYRKDVTVEDNVKALEILADLRIFVQMGFIMFDHKATVEDIAANQEFLAKAKAMFPKDFFGYIYPTSRLIPLSGSQYLEDLRREGALKGDYLGYDYDFEDKKVNMLYNVSSASSKMLWGVKRRFIKEDSSINDGFPKHWRKE